MWSGHLMDQAKSGLDWTAISSVLAAMIALGGVVITMFVTLRTSNRSEDSKREAEFDDRVDAELTRVTGERDKVRSDNDRLREELDHLWSRCQQIQEREVAYRRWIREQGFNPDEVLASG